MGGERAGEASTADSSDVFKARAERQRGTLDNRLPRGLGPGLDLHLASRGRRLWALLLPIHDPRPD
ncbi:unnamed protein product [Haemonchus placei]|uniref:Uncharacterized protein n=1 Tax=Haemonchus placei TaxID=6290 RepID=A0A3P7SNH8_HAEPC|nr:unnamed protein product [Haemonchus placei]